jgi:hypothetical protein
MINARRGVLFSSLVIATLVTTLSASAQTAPAPPAQLPHPCNTMPEARQFDFWIGQWDVTPWKVAAPTPAQRLGFNDVHPILEHCVLSENWRGARGVEGKSSNYYDRNLGKWRQIWVDETGGILDYTGEFRDGAMRFQGWTLDARGNRVEQKLTFFAIAADTVRQLFESSTDGGKTWTPGFDGRYVKRH